MTNRRKPEVLRVRVVLDLEVVRGRRWRELALFREAVLYHFTPPALREKLIAMSEAVADQVLEELTNEPGHGASGFRPHLQAVLADLRHSEKSLREVEAAYRDEIEATEDREVLRLTLRLARAIEQGLAKIADRVGPG